MPLQPFSHPSYPTIRYLFANETWGCLACGKKTDAVRETRAGGLATICSVACLSKINEEHPE
jgi:hypothetical protein